jgi:hypothetical protein
MHKELIFETIPGLVRKNEFLPVCSFVSKNFAGTDNQSLYEENLKKMPADWYYRHNTVRYTFNKQGYRTDEFKNIDWKNSVVIFGCSNAFGVGLDDQEVVSYQLSKLINRPVINMGVGGSSITFNLHNSIILKDGYPTPLAVVQLWPDYTRTVYYNKKDLIPYGSWNIEHNNYMDVWTKDKSHSQIHAMFASKISKTIWKDTSYCEFSFFDETAKILNCKRLKDFDLARDMMHYGPKTHAIAAQKIADKINV